MRKLLLSLTLLSAALLLPPSSRAQFIVVGQGCGASGLSAIANDGTPVVCKGSPLVWTAVGGGGGSIAALNGDGPLFNVQNPIYGGGAKGTGRAVADAVVNGTTTITSATANFTAADNGKLAVVLATNFPATVECAQFVVTFVNSTTITSGSACAGTGSGFNLYIGPDDSAAVSAACTALTNSKSGGVIYFPPGNYIFSATSPVCTLANLQNATTQPGINMGGGWYADLKGTVNIWVFPNYAHTTGTGDLINATASGVPILIQNMNINGLGFNFNVANQTLFYSSGFIVAKDTNVWNYALAVGANDNIFSWTGDGGSVYGRSDFENVTTFNVQASGINCIGFRFTVYNSDISATDKGVNIGTGCGEGAIVGSNISASNGPAVAVNTSTTVNEVGYMTIDASQICASPGQDAVFAGASGSGTQTIYISNSNLNLGGSVGGTGTCGGVNNTTGIHALVNNTVRVTNTRIETAGTGKTFNNAGTIVDAGANTYIAPTFGGTGVAILNPSSQGITPTLTGTGACATITTQVPSSAGTPLSGTFKCTGATAASTVTITWPVNAQNGYNCRLADQTTTADSLLPTVGTATTCAASAATITQNDVIQWSAVPF